jgi:hypothetical protein
MIYTCHTCAHQSEDDAKAKRPGAIQLGVERWCKPCNATRFHFAAVSKFEDAETGRHGEAETLRKSPAVSGSPRLRVF